MTPYEWTIPCEKRDLLLDVTFSLAGLNFSVSAQNYFLGSNGTYVSTFVGVNFHEPLAMLGLPSLHSLYSVYTNWVQVFRGWPLASDLLHIFWRKRQL
jgi:hypothetical protein